tara:strand:- start:4264 stop:5004 length:741 start_codon:yes stop_codon:yes gene_type:complete
MSVSLEEILTYLMLIIVGYFVAKTFSKTCNGFSVAGQSPGIYIIPNCPEIHNQSLDKEMLRCYGTKGCNFYRHFTGNLCGGSGPVHAGGKSIGDLSCSDVSSEASGWLDKWDADEAITEKTAICTKFGETNSGYPGIGSILPSKPPGWRPGLVEHISYTRCEYNEDTNMCEPKVCNKDFEYCFKNQVNYCHPPCLNGLLRDDGPGGSCECLPECCFEDKDNLEDCRRGDINCPTPPPAPLTEDIFV